MLNGFMTRIIGLLFVTIALCQFSLAQTISKSPNVSVKVKTVFNLTIDGPYVNFVDVKPGEWKEVPSGAGAAHSVVCKSNDKNEWTLSIKADGPLSGDTSMNIIPTNNMKWMTTYAGSKNSPYENLSAGLAYSPSGGYREFKDSWEKIYTSGKAVKNDNNNLPSGTEIQFRYALQTGYELAPGNYYTTVSFTMTQ